MDADHPRSGVLIPRRSTSGASVDLDLPDGQETIDAILTISGDTAAKLIVGSTSASLTLPGQQAVSALALGAHAATTTSWRGWVGKFGIWKMAASDTQLATIKAWLAA